MKIDKKYYFNVAEKMRINKLPRPKPKTPKILVTGWNEWLRIITIEAET